MKIGKGKRGTGTALLSDSTLDYLVIMSEFSAVAVQQRKRGSHHPRHWSTSLRLVSARRVLLSLLSHSNLLFFFCDDDLTTNLWNIFFYIKTSALIFSEGGVFWSFWSVEERKLSDPYNLITYPQEKHFDPLSQYMQSVSKRLVWVRKNV